MVFDHHGRLAGQHQVVLVARHVARRVGDGPAFRQDFVEEKVPLPQAALAVADADAAAEVVKQTAVPRLGDERIVAGPVVRRQHGDRVDEPVDGAHFDLHDVVHRQPVAGGGLRRIGRAAARSGSGLNVPSVERYT